VSHRGRYYADRHRGAPRVRSRVEGAAGVLVLPVCSGKIPQPAAGSVLAFGVSGEGSEGGARLKNLSW